MPLSYRVWESPSPSNNSQALPVSCSSFDLLAGCASFPPSRCPQRYPHKTLIRSEESFTRALPQCSLHQRGERVQQSSARELRESQNILHPLKLGNYNQRYIRPQPFLLNVFLCTG